MVRDTSIDAYKEDRSTLRDRILAAVKPGELITRRELAHKMGILTSTMSGRINELIALGLIEEAPELFTCQQSGRRVHAIRRTPINERPGVKPAGARTISEFHGCA